MLRLFTIAPPLPLLTVCAPAIKTQTIPVSTIPAGARVSVDGRHAL